MEEERLLILQMLRDGKITVEQAAQLLDALRPSAAPKDAAESEGPAEKTGTAPQPHQEGATDQRLDAEAFRQSMKETAQNISESVRSALGEAGLGDDLRRTIADAVDSAMRGLRVSLRGLRDLGSGVSVVVGESLRGVGDLFSEGGTPHISSWSWQGKIPAVGVFALHNPNGDVTIEGAEVEAASVKAVIRAWEKADGTVPPVPITVEEGGQVVRIRTRVGERIHFGHMPRVDFQITLPRGVNVEIHTVNGDVRLEGTGASLTVRSVNGDLTARQLAGELSVHTVNGDVSAEMTRADRIEIQSVSGDVVCRVAAPFSGRADLQSVSGDMELYLPSASDFTAEMQALSGDLDCRLPHVQLERRRRVLSLRVGSGHGHLRMKTISGDLVVREFAGGQSGAKPPVTETPDDGEPGPAGPPDASGVEG